eukprot:gnl/TRDRNA2_/TRDRNA2_81967_c1_seq1.p1 gnl/TRDRNA2_/TRDRNA2_81967_c1~~gnl/TRDRNA2_/TRDRNA2_81967_c1_seq1.p1  ORF type:complete len:498 (+),score=55.19 gnl/TRDRNA2_/TRDRNA2_81967_c1_seq1:1-1494(+)
MPDCGSSSKMAEVLMDDAIVNRLQKGFCTLIDDLKLDGKKAMWGSYVRFMKEVPLPSCSVNANYDIASYDDDKCTTHAGTWANVVGRSLADLNGGCITWSVKVWEHDRVPHGMKIACAPDGSLSVKLFIDTGDCSGDHGVVSLSKGTLESLLAGKCTFTDGPGNWPGTYLKFTSKGLSELAMPTCAVEPNYYKEDYRGYDIVSFHDGMCTGYGGTWARVVGKSLADTSGACVEWQVKLWDSEITSYGMKIVCETHDQSLNIEIFESADCSSESFKLWMDHRTVARLLSGECTYLDGFGNHPGGYLQFTKSAMRDLAMPVCSSSDYDIVSYDDRYCQTHGGSWAKVIHTSPASNGVACTRWDVKIWGGESVSYGMQVNCVSSDDSLLFNVFDAANCTGEPIGRVPMTRASFSDLMSGRCVWADGLDARSGGYLKVTTDLLERPGGGEGLANVAVPSTCAMYTQRSNMAALVDASVRLSSGVLLPVLLCLMAICRCGML